VRLRVDFHTQVNFAWELLVEVEGGHWEMSLEQVVHFHSYRQRVFSGEVVYRGYFHSHDEIRRPQTFSLVEEQVTAPRNHLEL